MRIALHVCIVSLALWSVGQPVAGQQKYGVSVKTVDRAALAKVKTYVWTVSQPSLDKKVDALIVAAVDRELAARGLTKLPSGKGDVEVSYGSLTRTDVDQKKPKKDVAFHEIAVGTLIVDLSAPDSRRQLFRVRMDTPIEHDLSTLEPTINAAVTAMFAKYPTPPTP